MASVAEISPAREEQLDPAVVPLLRELGDLKRITSAGRRGSIATRLFLRAWSALSGGDTLDHVARAITASALAAARLGDLDRDKLRELGLTGTQADEVLRRALDEVAGPLDAELADELRAALGMTLLEGEPPAFARQLAEQPRAGVTAPGKPRIMLRPEENHAEHCLLVCVYGVLLAPAYGADPARVFGAALAHHLHNAPMPDSGFAGEVLLGDKLDAVIATAREQALATLPSDLGTQAREWIAPISDDASPEARAFHAADVADRVLEIDAHLARAQVTMRTVLEEYELVHAGPVKSFHDRVLAELRIP